MARNLAQLVFLAYCFWLLFRSNRVTQTLLLLRMDRKTLKKMLRAPANKAAFVGLKTKLPPLVYWINLVAVCAFALDLVFQLLLGWFGFAAIPAKILNSAAVLAAGADALICAALDMLMRHDRLFVLAHWDPDGDKIFSSSLLDVLLFAVAPIVIVVSNFLAL